MTKIQCYVFHRACKGSCLRKENEKEKNAQCSARRCSRLSRRHVHIGIGEEKGKRERGINRKGGCCTPRPPGRGEVITEERGSAQTGGGAESVNGVGAFPRHAKRCCARRPPEVSARWEPSRGVVQNHWCQEVGVTVKSQQRNKVQVWEDVCSVSTAMLPASVLLSFRLLPVWWGNEAVHVEVSTQERCQKGSLEAAVSTMGNMVEECSGRPTSAQAELNICQHSGEQ